MSDRPQVAQQDLAALSNVPNDVWLDTLHWIGRAEVGTKFALVNARFDDMVRTHFNLRKWTLGELSVQRPPRVRSGGADAATAVISVLDDNVWTKALPMATTPPPAGVVGFVSLYIWYVDTEVITFLRLLQRVINRKGITLQFSIHSTDIRCWRIMAQHIWPLLSHAIVTLFDMKTNDFILLHRHVSRNVLLEHCDSLRKVYSHMVPIADDANANKHGAAAAASRGDNDDDDGTTKTPYQHLYRWLHTPRADGLPKMLSFCKWRMQWCTLMTSLKKSFHDPCATAVNYIITCSAPPRHIVRFQLENERTGELLLSNSRVRIGHNASLIVDSQKAVVVRCPLGTAPHKMVAWEDEMTELVNPLVHININDSAIGPSMLAELEKEDAYC